MSIDWNALFLKIKPSLKTIAYDILIIVGILFLANIVMKLISSITSKAMEKSKTMQDKQKAKGIATSMTIVRSVCRYVVYFIAVVTILERIGFKNTVNNVLVTAGIGTLIISMGAQNIVADFLAGFFLMFEHRYSVGDFVKIGDYEGTVTSIAMRATYLRNFKGQKIVIPNGKVSDIINYSSEYNMAAVNVPTPYEADTRKIIDMIKEVIDKYYQDNPDKFVSKPDVYAITSYGENGAQVSVCGKVKPLLQWGVERDWRLLIKERLQKEGITLPYTTVEVKKPLD